MINKLRLVYVVITRPIKKFHCLAPNPNFTSYVLSMCASFEVICVLILGHILLNRPIHTKNCYNEYTCLLPIFDIVILHHYFNWIFSSFDMNWMKDIPMFKRIGILCWYLLYKYADALHYSFLFQNLYM